VFEPRGAEGQAYRVATPFVSADIDGGRALQQHGSAFGAPNDPRTQHRPLLDPQRGLELANTGHLDSLLTLAKR